MEQKKADEDSDLYFTDLEYLQFLESKRQELDKITKIVAVDSTELGSIRNQMLECAEQKNNVKKIISAR